jgi:GTP cyclohydrolase I
VQAIDEHENQRITEPRMNGVLLSKIMEIANELFPLNYAEPWDNCGLQVGDPQQPIDRLAISLDPTPQTIKYAATRHCQLLVTHHPVVLNPVSRIVRDDYTGRVIMTAIGNGVNILSLHTNLDAAPGGLNDLLTAMLGLCDVVKPDSAPCARLGRLPRPMTVEELATKVQDDLLLDGVTVVAGDVGRVQSVFCVSGSGMSYLRQALSLQADIIITGDVRYHSAMEALEMGMPVIDAGHYGMEKFAVGLLSSSLQKQFDERNWQIEVFPCDSEIDPFYATMGSRRRESK